MQYEPKDIHSHQAAKILAAYGINTNIKKSEDFDLEKGGEGSRGGKIIGHTKSGKAIYENAKHSSHYSFSKDDHRDAANIYSVKYKEEKDQVRDDKNLFQKDFEQKLIDYNKNYKFHLNKITKSEDNELTSEKLDLMKSNFIKSINEIDFKNSLDLVASPIDLTKSNISKQGLHPEKVKITQKDGSVHYAIRWIKTDTGQTHDKTHLKKFKKESDIEGEDIHQKISNVINSEESKAQKTRDLMSLGIYDKDIITKYNGHDMGYAKSFLKQANISINDFEGYHLDENGNISEPEAIVVNPGNTEIFKGYKPGINIEMSLEAAREALSNKDFDSFKKDKIKSLKDKFGISADSMWLSYDRSIRQLLDTGQPKSIIAFGTGGVGKTFTLDQILADYQEKQGLRIDEPELDLQPEDYDVLKITGSTGKHDLWGTLYKHKDDKVIVFDDCDSMWKDDDMINWFKGMLDSSGNGTVRYGQGDKVKLEGRYDEDGEPLRAPRSFRFTSKVIFVSNMDRDGFVKAGAGPLFESRCKAIDLTMTKAQTVDKLNKISKNMTIRDNKGNQIAGVTDEDRQKAMSIINDLQDFTETSKLNGRTLGNLIGTSVYYRKNNFSDEEFFQEAVSLLTA